MGEPNSLVLPEYVVSFKSWYIFIVGKSQTAQTLKVLFLLLLLLLLFFQT